MATPIPANRVALTLAEVVAATGGAVTAAEHVPIQGVVTDSRADVVGKLFVALHGVAFDGHDYVADVLARGAAAALVDREIGVVGGKPVVRVADTLGALGDLARAHRRRWGGTLVAIGGSAGKTTTRGTVSALLEQLVPGAVAYERGNLNNRVGVPMVLFGVGVEHRIAVVEVGTNQVGEVPLLAAVCEPDVAVLTLVDLEHTEGLGDLDAIEREEGALLAAVGGRERGAGVAIANVDDPRARRQLGASGAARQLGYGTVGASDYRVVARTALELGRTRVSVARPAAPPLEFRCRLVGEPGALAAAAAIAVAEVVLGRSVEGPEVEAAFDRVEVREAGRLEPVELADGTVVLDDTYNANPASVRSSLKTARELATARSRRLILVLGEMRELGAVSQELHAELGRDVAAYEPAWLVGIGGDAVELVRAATRAGVPAEFVGDATAALAALDGRVEPGDVVLVKASRGVRAERVVAGLVGAQGAPR